MMLFVLFSVFVLKLLNPLSPFFRPLLKNCTPIIKKESISATIRSVGTVIIKLRSENFNSSSSAKRFVFLLFFGLFLDDALMDMFGIWTVCFSLKGCLCVSY